MTLKTRTRNLKPLINWLETVIHPSAGSCDNTLQRTEEYCRKWKIGFIRREKAWPIIDGIEVRACCDCEVICNGPPIDLGIEEPLEIHHEDEWRKPDHLQAICRCCHKPPGSVERWN